MKTWNERLKEALDESGEYQGNVNRFAGAVGVSAPSVAAWVGAANIRPAQDIKAAYLIKACCLLNVRPEWVLFGSGQKDATSIGVNPEANVTDSNNDQGIPGLINRLHALREEVQNIISIAQGLPVESITAQSSHDTSIASVRRDAAATMKLAESVRHEGEEHGKHKIKRPSIRGGKN